MSDRYWQAAADFVSQTGVEAAAIVAPDDFERLVSCVPYSHRDQCPSPKIVVLHKGQLKVLGVEWIEKLTKSLHPVFANEVFVIYSTREPEKSLMKSPHFLSLKARLSTMMQTFGVSEGIPVPETNVTAGTPTRSAVYLGNHLALTKTVFGHKIYVDTRDYSLAPHILMDGYWEMWITNVFRSAIRPGMKVVDIGANIGWYSLLAADLVGASGHLTAFEANPAMADIAYRNLMVNGFQERARVEAKAVYSENTQLELKIYDRYKGSSSLFETAERAAQFGDSITMHSVDAVTLDSFFPAESRVDFLKIDAEGAEPYILKGASRLLAENPGIQIMMEFAPSLIINAYGSIDTLCGEISKLGFSIWRIAHDSTLVKSSADDLARVAHCDVILKR